MEEEEEEEAIWWLIWNSAWLPLLRRRRIEDSGRDLWTAFNVVQENAVRGGLSGRVRKTEGRIQRRTTREVAGIDQSRSLNRALWLLTQRMAELKRA